MAIDGRRRGERSIKNGVRDEACESDGVRSTDDGDEEEGDGGGGSPQDIEIFGHFQLALAWATVVVVCGFAQYLNTIDLIKVGTLFLFEAIRVAASSTFGRLPFTNLFTDHEKLHPDEFTHRDVGQYYWASLIDNAGHIWTAFISVLTIASASYRLSIPRGALSLAAYADLPNIILCLLTFYIFTILTSFFALIAVILHFTRFFPCSSSSIEDSPHLHETSTTAFYDAVYHRAIESDLYSCFDISLLEFAFDKLRSDHVRGIQALAIEAYNRGLVDYIYDVPTGVEMAYQHLQDPDMYRQLVAINLAMFWFKKHRIARQIAYFAELGRKLEHPEKLAEAASFAIERLADEWADYPSGWIPVTQLQKGRNELSDVQSTVVEMNELHRYLHPNGKPYPGRHPFLEAMIDRASRMTVVDMLAELVIKEVRPKLVFQVSALESCCRSREVVDWIQGKDYYVELMSELLSILNVDVKVAAMKRRGPRERQRTKIYVASVRFHLERSRSRNWLLENGKGSSNNNNDGLNLRREEWQRLLEKIDPADTTEKYVWKKETELLDSLRQEVGLAPFDRWDKLKVKDPKNPSTL